MSEAVATLVQARIHHDRQAAPPADTVSTAVRQLFMLLHGSYGNLFISKFATGEKDAQGKDKGVRSAMKVWEARLGAYAAEVVEAAADRLLLEHPEFPPSLPQFEVMCRAVRPRKSYAEEQELPRLAAPAPQPLTPVSYEARRDGRDWARAILAGVEVGQKRSPTVVQWAREALELARGVA